MIVEATWTSLIGWPNKTSINYHTLRPYKLSVCADTLPGPPHPNQFQRWETGTLNFEGLAGIGAVIEYIASIGDRFPSKGKFLYYLFENLSIFILGILM